MSLFGNLKTKLFSLQNILLYLSSLTGLMFFLFALFVVKIFIKSRNSGVRFQVYTSGIVLLAIVAHIFWECTGVMLDTLHLVQGCFIRTIRAFITMVDDYGVHHFGGRLRRSSLWWAITAFIPFVDDYGIHHYGGRLRRSSHVHHFLEHFSLLVFGQKKKSNSFRRCL